VGVVLVVNFRAVEQLIFRSALIPKIVTVLSYYTQTTFM